MTSRDPLRRALALLDLSPLRFAAATALGSLAMAASVGLSAAAAWLIARAAQMPPVLDLTVGTVAVRAFGVSRAVFRYAERLVSHEVALRGMAHLRVTLYERLARGRLDTVAGLRRGDVLARTGADVDTVGDVVVRAYLPMAVALVVGIVTVSIVAVLSPLAGLVLALCEIASAAASMVLAGRAAAAAQREHVGTQAELAASVETLLDGAGELAVSGRRGAAMGRLRALERRQQRAADRRARPLALAKGLDTAALAVATIAAILIGVPEAAAGTLSPVGLAVVVLTPLASFEATAQLGDAATQLARSRAAAARIMELLDAAGEPAPDADDADRTWDAPATAGPALPEAAGGPVLRAEGLAAGWPGGPVVVEGVDLELRPGRAVALVGPSGVGKTTLLLTLAGLLEPRAGRVTLDGVDTATIDIHELAARVTLTPEDAHVFGTSVIENLRVARGSVTEAEAHALLARAGLGGWLAALPEGTGTMLGTEAATISGGERRRLLLARALAGTARILLLDEPGEHLDPATADALLTDLLRGGRDDAASEGAGNDGGAGPQRGTLVATHRLSALGAADEVIVLGRAPATGEDAGPARVRARGKHAELVAGDAAYRWAAAQEGAAHAPEPNGRGTHE